MARALLEAVGRAGKSAAVGTLEDHREVTAAQNNVVKSHTVYETQTACGNAASASSSSSSSSSTAGSSSCNASHDIDNADAYGGDSSNNGSSKRRRKLMNELQPMSSCRSLCGLQPTSTCAHVVTYSQFSSHLDTNDCIDASDREWTGWLVILLCNCFFVFFF